MKLGGRQGEKSACVFSRSRKHEAAEGVENRVDSYTIGKDAGCSFVSFGSRVLS